MYECNFFDSVLRSKHHRTDDSLSQINGKVSGAACPIVDMADGRFRENQ